MNFAGLTISNSKIVYKSTMMLNKMQINALWMYPELKNRLKDTHGVSNWSLQGSVLLLLAADMVESKKQMVVIG